MKRVLLIVVIVVGLVVVGLAVAITTFDVDRFRPQVIRRLEHTLGHPVQLDRIAVGWQGGITVQLQGLTVQGPTEPLLSVDSADAVLRLRPLLQRRLEVSSVRIRNSALHVAFEDPQRPLDVWLRQADVTITNPAPGRPMDVTLRAALGGDHPNVRLSGRLTPPSEGRDGSVEQLAVVLEDVSLEQLVPQPPSGSPRIRGRLTVVLEGTVPTLQPAHLAERAAGDGTVRLNGLTLEQFNVLRTVFERLSILPGLMQRLEERLSPEDRAVLTARDTSFAPIEAAVHLEAGAVQVEAVELRTDAFRLTGSGRVAFNGVLHLQSTLRISPGLSTAFIRSVEELRYLTNAQGELELPVTVQGEAAQLTVLPDLNYVASKVLVSKVQDVLEGFLEKALQ